MHSTQKQRMEKSPLGMMSRERIGNFRSLTMELAGRTVSLPNQKPDSAPALSMRLPSSSTPRLRPLVALRGPLFRSLAPLLHLRNPKLHKRAAPKFTAQRFRQLLGDLPLQSPLRN